MNSFIGHISQSRIKPAVDFHRQNSIRTAMDSPGRVEGCEACTNGEIWFEVNWLRRSVLTLRAQNSPIMIESALPHSYADPAAHRDAWSQRCLDCGLISRCMSLVLCRFPNRAERRVSEEKIALLRDLHSLYWATNVSCKGNVYFWLSFPRKVRMNVLWWCQKGPRVVRQKLVQVKYWLCSQSGFSNISANERLYGSHLIGIGYGSWNYSFPEQCFLMFHISI